MTYKNKINRLLSKIELSKARVDLSSPIIFLCGGKIDATSFESASVRNSIYEYILNNNPARYDQIVLAEHYTDWIHDATYNNLMEFEDDIAHISSLIIIVLESPGALTELGIFVKDSKLENKMLVLLTKEYNEQDSFISLGPLRHLKDNNNISVCPYPWNQHNVNSSIVKHLPNINNDIENSLQKSITNNSESFSKENNGHIAFLIYELIKLFGALKFDEIFEYLTELKIDITSKKTKRLLFVLIKIEIVATEQRGAGTYYYANKSQNRITFGARFDKKTSHIEIKGYYALSGSENTRLDIIQEQVALRK